MVPTFANLGGVGAFYGIVVFGRSCSRTIVESDYYLDDHILCQFMQLCNRLNIYIEVCLPSCQCGELFAIRWERESVTEHSLKPSTETGVRIGRDLQQKSRNWKPGAGQKGSSASTLLNLVGLYVPIDFPSLDLSVKKKLHFRMAATARSISYCRSGPRRNSFQQ